MAVVTGNRLKYSPGGIAFDVLNVAFLSGFAIMAIMPFFYIVAGSFASNYEFKSRDFFIIPRTFTLGSYQYILSSARLLTAFGISLTRTALGTLISMACTLTMAYPLSRPRLAGRNQILNVVIFCMMFSGGLIPLFFVVRGLHIFNTIWALVLPGAVNISNLIVVKTFFQNIPQELEEAARIDGCNDLQVFAGIVMPLSLPIVATMSLFYAVGNWNAWFDAVVFLNDQNLYPLQAVLRQMVMMAQQALADSRTIDLFVGTVPEEGMKMAVIVVSTLPILMVYPLLQRYFMKGALIGAIKG